ncbi:hypothetical protein J6TS1_16700 [Siminovitchia terrae]|uniref:Uncharacterized protein n=1 Tax=Siminovitchia terrae TaxID=1914933 RepID=A0ABQ4KUT1_SIMTE|nr:AraC family transcriptional regulator [Siminovitchia terrae]GIN93025.1 hypothetical protein J22TS1_40760 [Siminovitchia terrae]GIN95800.1 hypothetical protein J6TS1_16700 [Siminovitchia terrae]
MNHGLLIYSNDDTLIQMVQELNDECDFHFSIYTCSLANGKGMITAFSNYDLVIIDLDLTFPDEGLEREILHILKNNRAHRTRFVFMKSNPGVNEVREFLKAGAIDYLQKPLTNDNIYYLLHGFKKEIISDIDRNAFSLNGKVTSYLKSSLAYDLLYGSIKHSKEIWDRCMFIGLSDVPNTAMVMHIDDFYKLSENKSKQWEQSIRHEVIEGIQRFLTETVNEMLVAVTDADKIAVLLASHLKSSQREYKINAKTLAEQMKDFVKLHTGYSITIGIGNYYEDARNLHVSYQEAYRAQENKFFTGKNTVIHIDDVAPFVNEDKTILNYDVVRLATRVTMGDFAGVQKELTELNELLFSQDHLNPRVFHLQIIDILTTLARAAIHGGSKPKEIFSMHAEFDRQLKKLENIKEIKEWFEKVTNNMLDQVLINHNKQMLKSVQKAINYIDQHFDQQITLEEVSNHVSLSANYFSNMFKKTTGCALVEYISKLRVERAKVMLMDLSYTVYQIANKVGYNDSRYFSRVFKSLVGKTPSQYRNSLLSPSYKKEETKV